MKPRPQVLVLSQSLPYPPHSGVTNRTYHLLAQLQQEFDVIVVPFFRSNHHPSSADRVSARERLAIELTAVGDPSPIPGEHSLVRRFADHLRSAVLSRPYTYFEYASRHFDRQLESALSRFSPELIHLDSLDLYRYLDRLPKVPVACTHHSIESELLRLRADRLGGVVLPAYIRWQARLMEQVERTVTASCDMNVMMSDLDGERLHRLAPAARVTTVPNGVDPDFFAPRTGTVPGRTLFVGPSYSYPNRDAIQFYLNEVWPLVRAAYPSATFESIGRSPYSDVAAFSRTPGVIVSGHLEDIRPNMTNAECVVVPIRIGGGTRLKILDAWAMGLPVVSTSIGCEGLEARDGENIIIRDNPEEFARGVIEILANRQIREDLGRNGRKTVLDHYSWERVGAKLRNTYRQLVAQ